MDFTYFIPDPLKGQIVDTLVDFLARQADRLGQDKAARYIRQLSAQGAFYEAVTEAIEQGFQRFVTEYMIQDEDLVEALQAEKDIWQIEAVQQALIAMLHQPGTWLQEERETITQTFQTVLPQRINRQRVDKAVTYLLRCTTEALWTLPGAKEVRDVYSLQFQRLTAEATREQVALAKQQLAMTSQLNEGVRQALLQLTGAIEQNLLTAPTSTAVLLTSSPPYHNIPNPPYVHFVGREQELAWIRTRLAPTDRSWQIAITGIGGVGKSALALAIAHEFKDQYDTLPETKRFEAIIWVSAKEEVLTAHGREQASLPGQILDKLEDVYLAIARVLEREDITRAQPEEQSYLVDKALRRQRTLLIMDNLESVKDSRIKPFLRHLPPPTKALVTSREWLDVADILLLTGLSWIEADDLIKQEAAIRHIQLNKRQRRRLFELTAGLPLPINLGISRMASGESFQAVERWLGDAHGDLPEYCVQSQIELVRQRDLNAWAVLLACSLFDRSAGASRQALGLITDLSLADRDAALAQLQRLFLINRTEADRFWVLPIVQRFASTAFAETAVIPPLVEKWLSWLADFAQTNGHDLTENIDAIPLMEMEFPNLQTGIRWCHERQLWPQALPICAGTWAYAYQVSLLHELEEILSVWLKATQKTNHEQMKGQAHLHFARLFWIWGQADKALSHLNQAENILEKYTQYRDLAEAWTTYSQIFESQNLLDESDIMVQKILQLGEQTQDVRILMKGLRRSASSQKKRGNLQQSLQLLDRIEHLQKQSNLDKKFEAVLYRRADIYIEQGLYVEAERLLLEALQININIKARRFIAIDKLRLAEVYAVTGRVPAARQMAEEATELFERLGMRYHYQKANVFLGQLNHDT